MNNKKSLKQFKKNINLMFENNDKEIYLHKDDALKIEYYIYSLEQQCQKQQEAIDKAVLELVNIDGNLSNSQLSDRICNLIDILKEVQE